MPYPKEMLAPGETIVFEFGSHWSVLWQETAGSIGQSRLANIPEPEKMKNLISETRRNWTHSVARGGPAHPVSPSAATEHGAPSGKSSAEQLEILGRLFDEGKLSQNEYDSEKRKLLG